MGTLEVITGCMFSGKTTELFRRIRLAQLARPKESVIVYKPSLDTRSEMVKTHDGITYTSKDCHSSRDILSHLHQHPSVRVVGIDEVQFFDEGVVDVCKQLRSQHYRIIATGLNQDFRGEPFRFRDSHLDVGHLVVLANNPQYMDDAICMFPENGAICGKTAHCTQRLFLDGRPVPYDDPLVHPGGKDPMNGRRYEARCIDHHLVPGRPW